MDELKNEENQRKKEGKKVENWAKVYMAELNRRRIEEEVNAGNTSESDTEALVQSARTPPPP